jgi:hypothetical protein
MADIREMIEDLKQLSQLELEEIRKQFWGPNPGSRDYDIISFPLDTATTDKEWPGEGYFLYAWTNGSLDGISVRPNSKANCSIPFEQFGYESAVGFDRIWLTWTAQAGKTLYIFVGRRKGTHLSQVSVGGGGSGSGGGVENRDAWTHGHKTVAAAGTAEVMPTQIIPNGFKVVIEPLNSNIGLVFLGKRKVDCEDAAKRIEIDAGGGKGFYVTNLNLIWLDAEVAGEGVQYYVET